MARLPYVDPEAASPGVAAALAANPPLNIYRLMAHAETAFRPWLRLMATVLQDLELDPRLRELAILRVGALTPGASYEVDQHVAIARSLGVEEDRIRGALASAPVRDEDQLLLHFTEQVVSEARPDEPTLGALLERLGARQVVELVLVIGQYMTLGRLMATAEIDPDPPLDRRGSDSLLRGVRFGSGD